MAKKKRDSLQNQTDQLLGKLMGLALSQISDRGPRKEDDVGSGPNMSFSDIRGLLETSIRWQGMKAKLEPEVEEESDFERAMRGLNSGTAGSRRNGRASDPDAGVASDASGVDQSH